MPGIPFKLSEIHEIYGSTDRRGWRFLLHLGTPAHNRRGSCLAGDFQGRQGSLRGEFYQAYDHWAFSQALKGEPFSLGTVSAGPPGSFTL